MPSRDRVLSKVSTLFIIAGVAGIAVSVWLARWPQRIDVVANRSMADKPVVGEVVPVPVTIMNRTSDRIRLIGSDAC